MFPLAPGLLSTMTGTFQRSLSFCPQVRARMSIPVPGENGAMIEMVRLGYCAAIGPAHSGARARSARRRRRFGMGRIVRGSGGSKQVFAREEKHAVVAGARPGPDEGDARKRALEPGAVAPHLHDEQARRPEESRGVLQDSADEAEAVRTASEREPRLVPEFAG